MFANPVFITPGGYLIYFKTPSFKKKMQIEMLKNFPMVPSRIGGFHAVSGDTNNNGEINKCWWTNKAS